MTTITENTTIKKAEKKETPDITEITYHKEYSPTTEESVKIAQLDKRLDDEVLAVSEDVIKNGVLFGI